MFGVCLNRDVVELVFQNEGLISGRVNGGEKNSDGREIEVSAVERVWIWIFQPCGACTVESVDKTNG